MKLLDRLPTGPAETDMLNPGKSEFKHESDTDRHRDNNVVFNLRLNLHSQSANITQLNDTVRVFRYDDVAVEEKSNQFKSRKASSKHKSISPSANKLEVSDADNHDDPGDSCDKETPKPGTVLHAKALALSETFYKMDLAQINDQELLKISTDSKEVSWAFQLFLLNCELPLACKIAGRLTPFACMLIKNIYGNYAVQKLIIRLPTFRQFVVSLCQTYFWEMVFNQYSSRVLQLLSEINKPFAHFALVALLERPSSIGTRIETVFLAGAALRSMKGTPAASAFGFGYLKNYVRYQQVSKGKFSKRVLLSLAQNAEEDLLDQLQMLLVNNISSIKQHLADRTLMQFLSTMVVKLHRATLEVLFTALHNDRTAIERAVHSASFFKKVNSRLTSAAAKEIEASVCTNSLQTINFISHTSHSGMAVAAIQH
jgi:hypothetical protein